MQKLKYLGILSISSLLFSTGFGQITPENYSNTLTPGSSVTVTKTVAVPEVTPKLDLMLLIDLSGSYGDDLSVIGSLAPDIYDSIVSSIPDSRFGTASFIDFPISPYGSADDYAYSLDQDLTSDRTTWLNSIDGLVLGYGGDIPESQYEALYQIATGSGLDINGDGDYEDLGEIPPGLAPSWRPDATKVVAITTDAVFHDSDTEPDYPGHGKTDTINALVNAGIKVIAIKAPGAGSEMDDLAAATGGSVQTTSSSSAEIVDAILAGIEQLKFTITAVPVNCEPLSVTFTPSEYTDVSGGETVTFEETISVPTGIRSGTYECSVEFYADDTLIGTQNISITVPAPPPVARGDVLRGIGYTFEGRARIVAKLFCDQNEESLLSVTWRGNRFMLESVTSTNCDGEPFTTHCGTGTGKMRGVGTVNVEWCITDNGFPGRNRDTVELRIWNDTNTFLDITDVIRLGDFRAIEQATEVPPPELF